MSFITHLDAEIADLEAQLAADPRRQKLHELKRVRELYKRDNQGTSNPAPAERDFKLFASLPSSPGRRRSPERQKALDTARELLKGRTAPMKTADIFTHIAERGIKIGGSDPTNNLSAMLYHAKDFRSHGRDGWTLSGQAGSN